MMKLPHQTQNTRLIESKDFSRSLIDTVKTGNVLLVTSAGFVRRGVAQKAAALLGTSRVMIWDQITPNPDLATVQSLVDQYKAESVATIVALGGGSVIDTAKIAACLLAEPSLNLKDLLTNPVGSSHLRIYLIAVPTTAGTGAEVTPFATVWDRGVGTKYSVTNVAPDVAILDPELTLSLPRQETIYTALDALSHALESLWNKNRTPETAVYAHESIEMICQALPQVLATPGNYPARQQLQIAATLAGIAITQTRTAIAHAISYSLTAKYGVPHGLACSFTLAAIMREFGKNQLQIPESLFDMTLHLLEQLQLDKEIERYVDWQNIIGQAGMVLDPSRAGNFILDIDRDLLKRLLSASNAALSEEKHNEN